MAGRLFVQDDWRARKNLTLSGGLRAGAPDAHRTTAGTWRRAAGSPGRRSRTARRRCAPAAASSTTGSTRTSTSRRCASTATRQQDLVVANPGLSRIRSSGGVARRCCRPSKYMLADGLVMPKRSDGERRRLTQQLSPTLGLNVSYSRTRPAGSLPRPQHQRAARTARGRIPPLGNVTQVESTARMRGQTRCNTGLNLNMPTRRIVPFANYSLTDQKNDADGAFSLPADSYDLAARVGSARPAFRATSPAPSFNTAADQATCGSAFDVGAQRRRPTTSRPAATTTATRCSTIVPPASAATAPDRAGMWDVAARLSYAFGFGQRRRPRRHPAAARR